MTPIRSLLFAASAVLFVSPVYASSFDDWPAGCSPREVGGRVAARFAASPHARFNEKYQPPIVIYPEVCTWYGALTFAELVSDKPLTCRLVQRFEPLFGEEKHLVPVPNHVDSTVFATVPLELAIQTKDARCLALGLSLADKQWEVPADTSKLSPEALAAIRIDLSPQTRYWIDDMYMITMVQTQAYRATGEVKYIDRAAREMASYLDQLQQPNGLFFHAPDVPFFWGRGNGWFAAGMSELLRSLPESHPSRARVMQGYQKMMEALLKCQDGGGMWRQLIDHPESWPETSCTGMFTFAMVSGVKNGWLDEATYGPAARKGWLALIKYINADGDIAEVCEGTNKKNDLQYYLDRKRRVGDMHGQAPVLWCASALLRRPAGESKK